MTNKDNQRRKCYIPPIFPRKPLFTVLSQDIYARQQLTKSTQKHTIYFSIENNSILYFIHGKSYKIRLSRFDVYAVWGVWLQFGCNTSKICNQPQLYFLFCDLFEIHRRASFTLSNRYPLLPSGYHCASENDHPNQLESRSILSQLSHLVMCYNPPRKQNAPHTIIHSFVVSPGILSRSSRIQPLIP